MADTIGLGPRPDAGLLDLQATRRVEPARQGQAGGPGDAAKIEKSARDFESILLGSWLQQAEKSFASVPGGDSDDDQDPGKDQFQSMAMQSLGASLAGSGGIGIAKMIAGSLRQSDRAAAPGPGEGSGR
jgi:Rod binding domain-containing protein